ncbi:MAG: hypothetical protein LBD27_08300 [Tannerella sp.]|jgi:sporulation-control protein spo0M|nr:hypothetical protein [Tannerella sp.]
MKNNQTIASKLHRMEDGILGVKNNPEIQGRMNRYGYTPDRIAEGEALLNEAKELVADHAGKYGHKYVATDELDKTRKASYSDYMVTLKVLRVAFRQQPEQLMKFNAVGRRRRSLSGWLNDARVLYTNLLNNSEALTEMEKYGYTVERLEVEQQQVEKVAAFHNKRLGDMGEAQQMTQDRDQAIDAAYDWFSDFRAIARIALYDRPQWIEALGIVKK